MREYLDPVIPRVSDVIFTVASSYVAGSLKCTFRNSVTPDRKKFFAVMRKCVQPIFIENCYRSPANMNSMGFLDRIGKSADFAAVRCQHDNSLVIWPDTEELVLNKNRQFFTGRICNVA